MTRKVHVRDLRLLVDAVALAGTLYSRPSSRTANLCRQWERKRETRRGLAGGGRARQPALPCSRQLSELPRKHSELQAYHPGSLGPKFCPVRYEKLARPQRSGQSVASAGAC